LQIDQHLPVVAADVEVARAALRARRGPRGRRLPVNLAPRRWLLNPPERLPHARVGPEQDLVPLVVEVRAPDDPVELGDDEVGVPDLVPARLPDLVPRRHFRVALPPPAGPGDAAEELDHPPEGGAVVPVVVE